MSLINFDNKYNSESLLFSIPVHESHDIINNQIENILNNNPNANIIIHPNKSFTSFNKNLINYKNVYINENRINYIYGSGLLYIHINNFLQAIELNINFKYFILLSSNEMFIKKGCIEYINQNKNGIQLVEYNENISWHNFNKKYDTLINNVNIRKLLDYLNLKNLFGGQSEGQFFQKDIFNKISDIFLKFFNDINTNFETEEIILQTIFYSLNEKYGDPITLQNYSNKLTFDNHFIKRLLNNTIIPNNTIDDNLVSPHVNKFSNNIYSIKRIDRTFNSIRKLLTSSGLILNKNSFQQNTYYYSNSSSLFIGNDKIEFNKNNTFIKDFQWFGFNLSKNMYIISFDFDVDTFINEFYNIGIKIHKPFEHVISNIFYDIRIGVKKNINIPIIIDNKQDLIFIFDDLYKTLKLNIYNLSIEKFNINIYKKKKIILLFHDNYVDYNNELFNYLNIKKQLIEPLSKLYDVFIFMSLKKDNSNNINIIKNLNPHKIIYNDYESINNILLELLINSNNLLNNLKIEFYMMFPINIIFKKNIKQVPFVINKINFLSYIYPYYDKLNYNHNVLIFNQKYYKFFTNLLKNNLNNDLLLNNFNRYIKNEIKNEEINILLKDNLNLFDENKYFKYNNQIYLINNIKNNEGFLFDNYYDNYIIRSNLYSYFYKIDNNHYYYYKKKFKKLSLYNWCGFFFHTTNKEFKNINIKISFSIKINTKINNDYLIGIKTHHPEKIYNEWLKDCDLHQFNDVSIETEIEQKNQEIILFFDEYLDEIEFYIKNFKIIYNL